MRVPDHWTVKQAGRCGWDPLYLVKDCPRFDLRSLSTLRFLEFPGSLPPSLPSGELINFFPFM